MTEATTDFATFSQVKGEMEKELNRKLTKEELEKARKEYDKKREEWVKERGSISQTLDNYTKASWGGFLAGILLIGLGVTMKNKVDKGLHAIAIGLVIVAIWAFIALYVAKGIDGFSELFMMLSLVVVIISAGLSLLAGIIMLFQQKFAKDKQSDTPS